MTDLITIISGIVTHELIQDETVISDSFNLDPVNTDIILKGNGKPEEVSTTYQLDIFFDKKGKLVAKTKLVIDALSDYSISDATYVWEKEARLWRASMRIETL